MAIGKWMELVKGFGRGVSAEDSPPDEVELRQDSCLIAIHGSNLGKKFDLDKNDIIIGRSEKADIRIDSENVSRIHAKLSVNKGKVIVEDQGSTNGILVNDKRTRRAVLADGDLLLVGNTLLKFISADNVENAYHDEIYRLATMDGLTQIFNKKHFTERLHQEFGRCRRYNRELSLVMFDIDHFKVINDIHGHQAGDYVLKKLAAFISKNLRKEDIFGRCGGEEFSIILPETDGKKATIMAEKLRKMVEGLDFTYSDRDIPVTISVGVASFHSETNRLAEPEELVEQADSALYNSKNNGRNRVYHFSELR